MCSAWLDSLQLDQYKEKVGPTNDHAGKASVGEDYCEEPAHKTEAVDSPQIVHGVIAVRTIHV